MKTEVLNEYIYTKLVIDIAVDLRKQRVLALCRAGASDEELDNDSLTRDDLSAAANILESCRVVVSDLLKEARPDLSE